MKKKFIIIILVILLGIFIAIKIFTPERVIETPLFVISSIPKNNEVFVSEKSEIVFNLNRNITNEEGLEIKVEFTPSIKTENVYSGNKIRISPTTEFNLNTKYEIKIYFKENLVHTFNFETNPFSKQQIEEEGLKQTQLDLDFNEKYEEFYKNYPWYGKIPIETSKYLIVYDFEKESFKIILKIKINNVTERREIEREATQDIIGIGVKGPIDNYYLQEIETE